MELTLAGTNWLAILVCVVVGQIFLTIWFLPLFGEPWARAYGGEGMTRAQHTAEVPGYTYAIGALCVFLLSLGVSVMQRAMGVDDVAGALMLAVFLSVTVFVAMAMPGYAFLRRWSAFVLGAGSQVTLILILSLILVLWR